MLRLFNTDMAAAKQQGRTLGESRVRAYLLRGSGVIVSQDSRGVALSVTGPETRPEIMIRTGLFISGNAVRDASGLVDVSAFADTMKFNRVSSEINKIVVAEVIKPFLAQSPAVGQRVSFVGAAEVAEDATEDIAFGEKRQDSSVDDSYHLLQVVPIRLMVE
jgi:predicted lipoprotein